MLSPCDPFLYIFYVLSEISRKYNRLECEMTQLCSSMIRNVDEQYQTLDRSAENQRRRPAPMSPAEEESTTEAMTL